MTPVIWSTLFFATCYGLEFFAHWLITGSRTTRYYPLFYALPALLVGHAVSLPVFFFSAMLMVTAITDLHYMLIHRIVTLGMLPLALGYTYYSCGDQAFLLALAGAATGYLFLWALKAWFWYTRGIDGLGEGDLDLVAFIGALVGVEQVFTVRTLAATSALMVVGIAIYAGRMHPQAPMPFGTFLALAGLVIYCLC